MYGKGEGLLCYATDADQRALLDAHEGFRPGLPASEKADLRWRDYAVLLDLVRLLAFVSENWSSPRTKDPLDASAALSPPLLYPVSEDVDVDGLATKVDSLAVAGASPPLPDGFRVARRPANRLVSLLAGTRLWPAVVKATAVRDFGKRVSSASRFVRGSAVQVPTEPVVVFRRRTGSRSAVESEFSTEDDGYSTGGSPVRENIPTEVYPTTSKPGVSGQVELFSRVFGCSPADLGVDLSSEKLFDHEVNGGFVSASPLSSGLVDACYGAVGTLLECDVLLLDGSARAAEVPGHSTTTSFDYSYSGYYDTETGDDTRRDPDTEYVADPGDETNVRPASCTVSMTYSWSDSESTSWDAREDGPGRTRGSVLTELRVRQTVSDTASNDPVVRPLDFRLAFSVPGGFLDPFVANDEEETDDGLVASGTVVMPVSLYAYVFSGSSESNRYGYVSENPEESYSAGYNKRENNSEIVNATVVVPVAVAVEKNEETGEWLLVSEKTTLEDVVRAAWEAADSPDGAFVATVPSSYEKPQFAPDVARRAGSGGNYSNSGGGSAYYYSYLRVTLGDVGVLDGTDDSGNPCGYPDQAPWLRTVAVLKLNPRIRETVFGG